MGAAVGAGVWVPVGAAVVPCVEVPGPVPAVVLPVGAVDVVEDMRVGLPLVKGVYETEV